MSITNAYIDGFNLYHAIDATRDESIKWLNPITLVKSYLRQGDEIGSVKYFTSPTIWSHEKEQRHLTYIAALKAIGVDVVQSSFKKNKRYCKKYDRRCSFWEEKQNDVALSVAMMADAFNGYPDRIILITADSDQIPTVKHLLNHHHGIELFLAIPPGRKDEARELGALFSAKTREEISLGRLRGSLLPAGLPDGKGKQIKRPAKYNPG